MISLDTNVVISSLNPADINHAPALAALQTHAGAGYCICPPVYTELRATPYWAGLSGWLTSSGTRTLWPMPEAVWELAGTRFLSYRALRRSGNAPRRIAADFLIAAHAEHHGLDVMSFDRTVYDSVFTDVTLIEPTSA